MCCQPSSSHCVREGNKVCPPISNLLKAPNSVAAPVASGYLIQVADPSVLPAGGSVLGALSNIGPVHQTFRKRASQANDVSTSTSNSSQCLGVDSSKSRPSQQVYPKVQLNVTQNKPKDVRPIIISGPSGVWQGNIDSNAS